MSKFIENNSSLLEDLSARNLYATSFPIIMYIETVKGCPYSCIMCDTAGTNPRDISPTLLEKISPFFEYLQVLAIHGDGEPLLSRNIDLFINASQKNNCLLHMNTTAFFLKPALAEKLLSTKLSIRFSIHAGKSETYKKIMGSHFDTVIKNISYLIKRGTQIGSKENDFWFSYIVMKENIDEIDDFLYLANGLGIRKVRFMSLYPTQKTIAGVSRKEGGPKFYFSQQFNRKVAKLFLEKLPHIKELAQKLGISICPGRMEYTARCLCSTKELTKKICRRLCPLMKRKGMCMIPWVGQVHIMQNGNVRLCCATEYILGNLYDEDFDKIWNAPRIQSIRKEFKEGNFPRICDDCEGIKSDEYPINLFRKSPLY